MKSPTHRSRREDTPFVKSEEIWIIRNAGNLTPNEIRRKFIVHFGKTNHKKVPHRKAFARLVERFDTTGGMTASSKEPMP